MPQQQWGENNRVKWCPSSIIISTDVRNPVWGDPNDRGRALKQEQERTLSYRRSQHTVQLQQQPLHDSDYKGPRSIETSYRTSGFHWINCPSNHQHSRDRPTHRFPRWFPSSARAGTGATGPPSATPTPENVLHGPSLNGGYHHSRQPGTFCAD